MSTENFSGKQGGIYVRYAGLYLHLATFLSSGTTLISSMSLSGNKLAQNGQLVIQLQNAPDPDFSATSATAANGSIVQPPSVQRMLGRVDSITVEQSGPVRGVIKVWKVKIIVDNA